MADFVSRKPPIGRVSNKPQAQYRRPLPIDQKVQSIEPKKAAQPTVYQKCVGALIPVEQRYTVAKMARIHGVAIYFVKVPLRVGAVSSLKVVLCSASNQVDALVRDMQAAKMVLQLFDMQKAVGGVKGPNLYRDHSIKKRP